MARVKTPIPTAEDIKRINEARLKGAVVKPLVETVMEGRIRELEQELALAKQPTKLTPTELKNGLDEILRRYGVEPAEEIIKLLLPNEEGQFQLSAKDRAAYWMDMMQYRQPKLRAVEHSGKVDSEITLVVMKFSTNEVIEKKVLKLEDEAIEMEVTNNGN